MTPRLRPFSIVLIDIKGSMLETGTAHTLLDIAREYSMPASIFTLHKKATCAFNPTLSKSFLDLSHREQVEFITEAVGITVSNSTRGADRFFSSICDYTVSDYWSRPEIITLQQLHYWFERMPHAYRGNPKDLDHARGAVAALSRVATVEALNVTPETHSAEIIENQIDCWKIIRQPQLIYLHLNALAPETVSPIVYFMLRGLLNAKIKADPEEKTCDVYVAIDEYPVAANAAAHTKIVNQAAGAGIFLTLTAQNMNELIDLGPLYHAIQGNMNVRAQFSANDAQSRLELSRQSGLREHVLYDDDQRMPFEPHPDRPRGTRVLTNSPVFDALTLIEASARPDVFLLQVVKPSKGYSNHGGRMQLVSGSWIMSKEEWDRQNQRPWPKPGDYPGLFIPDNIYSIDSPVPPGVRKPAQTKAEPKKQEKVDAESEQQPQTDVSDIAKDLEAFFQSGKSPTPDNKKNKPKRRRD